jgi:RNA polymerase sigma-54 factor
MNKKQNKRDSGTLRASSLPVNQGGIMDIGINLNHQINTSQQLNLAPQLLQWLRLLHLPTTELASIVQKELEKNPALEVEGDSGEDHEPALEDSSPEDSSDNKISDTAPTDQQETSDKEKYDFLAEIDEQWKNDTTYSPGRQSSDSDEDEKHRYILDSITSEPSLHEHLLRQLPVNEMNEEDTQIAEIIIGSIDEKGYLSIAVEELAAVTNVPLNRIEKNLSIIHSLDPAGIAARDLRECLLLQMHNQDKEFLPRLIVRDHLEALGRKQHAEIAQALGVNTTDVLEAQRFIMSLNPAPGSKYFETRPEYISPDIIVNNIAGEYIAELNDARIPRLRISASCKQLIERPGLKSDESSYLRNKIRSATFLIQGIRQRQATLQKVADQIVNFQKDYFVSSKGELKPLTMAKIAAIIGVHETTVSRAIANKHISTPRGLFEMKHFFRSGYRCADGSAMTPEMVKDLITDLIDKENPVTPLKDITIARLLEKKGLKLARRTIAKYREEMDLPSSKERRRQMLAVSKKNGKEKHADTEQPGKHILYPDAEQKSPLTADIPFSPENIQSAVA